MASRKQSEAVTAAAGELKAIVERIERLLEEKQSISDDVKQVYAEAKGNGFDTHALRAIIKRRAQDAGELAAYEEILEAYMRALGMI